MTLLPYRNALGDHDYVQSTIVYDGRSVENPSVTIAIPTYNRPELALEALKSALAQSSNIALEIILVDNASDPGNTELLHQAISSLGNVPVRYFVNQSNIGMFGNWNRCITLARGKWVTILNDDDLLNQNYLERMLIHIDLDVDNAAYTCGFSILDDRGHVPRTKAVQNAFVFAKRIIRSRGRKLLKITPKQLFWSHLSGTGLGMLFPKSLVMSIGGFYTEEFPTADYFLHTRLAISGNMFQVMENLTTLRIGVNESQNPATLLKIIINNQRLRVALIKEGFVPDCWKKMFPYLISYERKSFFRMWGAELSKDEIKVATGVEEYSLPRSIILLQRLIHDAL